MAEHNSKAKSKTSTASSVNPKKPGFLGFLSCCFSQERTFTLPRPSPLAHPTFTIDIDNPPQKSPYGTTTAVGSFNDQSYPYFRNSPIAESYPIDKVFILGSHHKIVAKITMKKVLRSSSSSFASFVVASKEAVQQKLLDGKNVADIPATAKKEIFSMYDKGIKAIEWHEITPENIAEHIAKRLHCSVMVDALCGYGGNTIQFAKYCDYVLGIDIEPHKTLSAKHNAQIYEVEHKIDFITVDFLKLKNLMGDVVFLGPSDVRTNRNQSYSIFKHAEPDLRDLLAKSLEISYSIALKLPGDTDLDELSELFNVSLEKYGLYSRRFCIEIEQIMNSSGEVECLLVYFGECSSIDLKEEYEAIYDYLAQNETPEWKSKFPLHVVTNILRIYGTRNFFTNITRIQEQPSSKIKVKNSLFSAFLEDLIEKNVFTKSSLKKIIDEDSHSTNAQNFLLPKQGPSIIPAHFLTLNPKVHFNTETRFNKDVHNPSIDSKSYSEDPLNLNFMETSEDDHGGDTQIENVQKSLFQGELSEIIEFNRSLSHDVSELNVSSYSVNSSYLKESSEGSSPFRSAKKSRGMADELSLNNSDRMYSLSFERINSSPRRRSQMHRRGASQPGRNFRGCNEDRQIKKSAFEASRRKIAEC